MGQNDVGSSTRTHFGCQGAGEAPGLCGGNGLGKGNCPQRTWGKERDQATGLIWTILRLPSPSPGQCISNNLRIFPSPPPLAWSLHSTPKLRLLLGPPAPSVCCSQANTAPCFNHENSSSMVNSPDKADLPEAKKLKLRDTTHSQTLQDPGGAPKQCG